MGRLVKILNPEKYAVMQWHTQDVNTTNNLKIKVDFALPAHSVTDVVTCKWHVDDFTKGGYDMILE